MLKLRGNNRIILASSSPRRRELLSEVGLTFTVLASSANEESEGEGPQALVERLAPLKAETVAADHQDAWVIGADTIVVQKGEILGKPRDKSDAIRMLSLLQGTTHEVWTGMAVINLKERVRRVLSSKSIVEMIPLNSTQVEAYVETGEPMDKAGSYAIQGIGAHLVASVQGSYTCVVGLDVAKTIGVLRELSVIE